MRLKYYIMKTTAPRALGSSVDYLALCQMWANAETNVSVYKPRAP